MDCKVLCDFKGEINGVGFDDQLVYNSVQTLLGYFEDISRTSYTGYSLVYSLQVVVERNFYEQDYDLTFIEDRVKEVIADLYLDEGVQGIIKFLNSDFIDYIRSF